MNDDGCFYYPRLVIKTSKQSKREHQKRNKSQNLDVCELSCHRAIPGAVKRCCYRKRDSFSNGSQGVDEDVNVDGISGERGGWYLPTVRGRVMRGAGSI